MSRLGKMPSWQKWFVILGLLSCSLTGIAYLLGTHALLSWHGITAVMASLALGTILPLHLKAGLKANRKILSGISQLVCLSTLLITGVLLYYGPAEIRDNTILVHWLIGLLFLAIFLFHSLIIRTQSSLVNSNLNKSSTS